MSDKNIDINIVLKKMAADIDEFVADIERDDMLLVGIRTGGLWIASRLHKLLKLDSELGELNISFYRDDFSMLGLHPEVKPSKLPIDITDKHIILIDDVLYTGRTIRAAMNEIFDYGRPATITLAVLIDRNAQELPICADIVGKSITLNEGEHVKLLGPEPLALEIKQTG
ncbi:MAG: bifunctional pyr operon transcriptional regulator/uracil phosphoribosyltransferase PyrR [Pseudomonadota bacterium]